MQTNSHFEQSELTERLDRALDALYEYDFYLIRVDANERSITHYLAIYLMNEFQDWHVDVEYNRNLGVVKRLIPEAPVSTAEDTNALTVYPDIIVHRRDTDENLLVIEVKKANCRDHGLDYRKLKAFTQAQPAGLGYAWGAHVILQPTGSIPLEIIWFRNGEQLN